MRIAPESLCGTQVLAAFASCCGLALLLAAAPATAGGASKPAAGSAAAGVESPSPEAAAACVERAVTAIQRRYEEVRDLRADFVQRTRSVSLGGPGGREQEARGRVVFAKPGKMRWVYSEPEQSVVVSDGETLWLYDPAQAEVQTLPVAHGYFSGAAVQFLIGEGNLRRDFDVQSLECADDAIQLELIPKEPSSYEKLRVRTDPSRGDLDRTTVYDLLGNVTEVTFHGIEINQQPAPEVFRFEVPEGVQVIDLAAPSP